jgi:hypothetical protein
VQATGSSTPDRYGGHRRPLQPYRAELERLVAAEPDLILAELQGRLVLRPSPKTHPSTVNSLRARVVPAPA